MCTNATIFVNGTEEQPWTWSQVINDDCEDICLDTIQIPTVSPEITIESYRVDESSSKYEVTFKRSKAATTTDPEDKIKIEIFGPQCDERTCDSACVTCLDNSCHPPGYQCPSLESYITVQKIVPLNISLGENQVNILIKNEFSQPITDVTANLSGYGLKTTKILPIASLEAGDKDYVFLTINASQTGQHDIVIRVRSLFGGREIVSEFVNTLTILNNVPSLYNRTELIASLANYRGDLRLLETEYTEKRADGYQLFSLEDTLKETKGLLVKAQTALTNDQLAEANEHLSLVSFNLDDIRTNLQTARKPKRSISEVMKDNIFWISALITTLAGALALYEKQRHKMATLKEKVKHLATHEEKSRKTQKSKKKRQKPSSPKKESSSTIDETIQP